MFRKIIPHWTKANMQKLHYCKNFNKTKDGVIAYNTQGFFLLTRCNCIDELILQLLYLHFTILLPFICAVFLR